MEPETVYNDRPNGLGEKVDRQSKEVEHIPFDVGNRLAGAPIGPAQFGAGGTSDLRLLRRAVRERWAIAEELRSSLPRWLGEIVSDDELDVRGRVGAAKVLVDMDKLNMDQEQVDAGGARVNVDITTGGKPLLPEAVKAMTPEQIEERIRALEGG